MSAKNTAVNCLILTTYVSFLFYRRTGKRPTVSWAARQLVQFLIFASAMAFVISLGVYGYFVEAAVRIGSPIPQVLSVLFAMVSMTVIDASCCAAPRRPARPTGARSRRSRSTC